MATEIWFRNPLNYIRELIECNETNIVFDYGMLVKRSIKSPKQWADLYFGLHGTPYRVIAAGAQGAAEYRPGSDDPIAVYPVVQYGDDESILEGYMARNIGDDDSLCSDTSIDILERPVKGQEHRVMVMNFPDVRVGPGKKYMAMLKELQEEYPDVILHVHGIVGFSVPVRLGFRATDFEPRWPAAHGTIFLPTGYKIEKVDKGAHLTPYADWIRVLGFKPVDLKEPRNRCLFNIRAAKWAGDNYTKDLRIAKRSSKPVDHTSSDSEYDPEENTRILFKNVRPKPGDKFVCNSCSLAMACKFYREGSVCTVPGSEPKELADLFKTRDVESLMDGVRAVIELNAQRATMGMRMEEDFGLDPEVTKILSAVTKDAEKLAKLVDPSLRGPKVNINVGQGGAAHVSLDDPRQYIARAIRELELQGFRRDQITPGMIEGILTNAGARPREVEGRVVESRVERYMADMEGRDTGTYDDLVPVP